ncbi:unnamed protein product [Calicophoron daubneyi]|uniref:Multidrug resistance protein 1 n=1 Tax=Calicophoron daubneyi TaxID=300641 RepID=A0AAV2TSC1_CALDB
MRRLTIKELQAYGQAGAIAGEVLAAIRTVFAFGGEKKELERYTGRLKLAEKVGIKKSTVVGAVMGGIGFAIFSAAALVFWYGVELILTESYDAGSVILIFINVIMGSIFLGNALPNFQYFLTATASAKEVYGIMARIPPIDKEKTGRVLSDFEGNIVFQNLTFAYPLRPEVTVLKEFNLILKRGQTVALVGPSGSGKSTIVNLIQRFYDPLEGEIIVEGINLRDLDLKAFRAKIGCVQQEPVLFEGTVTENIRMGKLDATQDEIEEAGKLANAHDFIMKLSEGYNTHINERGGGMSGGQKQRIAIARALLRKPKLLLLDEATSALDTKSERLVQCALDTASSGRTVLVVAHRLTTVRNADLILVFDKGMIRESGTHEELVAANGLYAAMLCAQKKGDGSEEDTTDDHANPEGQEEGHIVWHNEDLAEVTLPTATPRPSISSRATLRHLSAVSSVITGQYRKMYNSPIARILRMNRPEIKYIILGCICCLIAGACQPAFALVFSEIYAIFTLINDPPKMRERVSMIAGVMVGIGCARILSMLGQGYFFGVSGERLTRRVRSNLFQAMLNQEIGWFDRPENQPGALTSKLATEASRLSALSGSQLGMIIEAAVLLIMSLVIAFIYSWQLTLLIFAFLPIVVLSGMLWAKSAQAGAVVAKDEKSMRIAGEAISTDRTVFTFGLEGYFSDRFVEALEEKKKSLLRDVLLQALLFGLTQSISYFCFAATFALGAYLVDRKEIEMVAVFKTYTVLTMGAQSLGRTASLGPDARRANAAAANVLRTLDRKPRIPTDKGMIPTVTFKGNVEFRHVHFRYPCRKETLILKDFSHVVTAGQTVALVGQSGCGKSTLIQLVQRLYDPTDGDGKSGVFFDGMNLRDLAPVWIRRQIGIVSQEPNLFDLSIRDNIAYGCNYRVVSMEEVIEAARQANIHTFITTLPNGYETIVGQRGSQLSGGQKQRIAIARALVRKPVLLLLDEATSALDNESERIVQDALDTAMGSRTSLVIAHRLSTVMSSQLIVVLENGYKIEVGTPMALLQAKGAFYSLHNTEQATGS